MTLHKLTTTKKEALFITLAAFSATVGYMLFLAKRSGGIDQLSLLETSWPSLPYLLLFIFVVSTKNDAVKKQKLFRTTAILMAIAGGLVFWFFYQDSAGMGVAPFLPLLVMPIMQLLVLLGAVFMLPSINEVGER